MHVQIKIVTKFCAMPMKILWNPCWPIHNDDLITVGFCWNGHFRFKVYDFMFSVKLGEHVLSRPKSPEQPCHVHKRKDKLFGCKVGCAVCVFFLWRFSCIIATKCLVMRYHWATLIHLNRVHYHLLPIRCIVWIYFTVLSQRQLVWNV